MHMKLTACPSRKKLKTGPVVKYRLQAFMQLSTGSRQSNWCLRNWVNPVWSKN